MRNFFQWAFPKHRAIIILGKGPTIENINKYDKSKFLFIGLNEATLYQKCFLTHFIDFDILDHEILRNSLYFVSPWYPHINFKCNDISILDHLQINFPEENLDNFFWYNCSTWKGEPKDNSPIIRAKYFSVEAVFHLLALSGIRIIHTAGVDGGKEYHPFFKQKKLSPLQNGRDSFDCQFEELNKTCKKFDITWVKL